MSQTPLDFCPRLRMQNWISCHINLHTLKVNLYLVKIVCESYASHSLPVHPPCSHQAHALQEPHTGIINTSHSCAGIFFLSRQDSFLCSIVLSFQAVWGRGTKSKSFAPVLLPPCLPEFHITKTSQLNSPTAIFRYYCSLN